MTSFRTPETQAMYEQYAREHQMERGDVCDLCEKPALHEFRLWKVVKALAPYDAIVDIHHMLVPKRHTTESGLTDEERAEFTEIKHSYLRDRYDYIVETTRRSSTIPSHLHLHLLKKHAEPGEQFTEN